jgi:prevent-host-death family protein
MKTITIRQLHEKTGEYIRSAAETGEIYVTDRGKTIARIVPEEDRPGTPYFARRHLTPAFRKLTKSGKLGKPPDSTFIVSEDRDRPIE